MVHYRCAGDMAHIWCSVRNHTSKPGYRRWRPLATVGVDDGTNRMSNVTIELGAGISAVVSYGLLLSQHKSTRRGVARVREPGTSFKRETVPKPVVGPHVTGTGDRAAGSAAETRMA
jgi:hypothetical protein